MTQEELAKWWNEHSGGDPKKLQYKTGGRAKIENPNFNPALDAPSEKYTEVQTERWEAPDGAYIEVYRDQDNPERYKVVGSATASEIQRAGQTPEAKEAATRKNREEQELENEKTYNASHGGLYETHAERRVREQREQQQATAASKEARGEPYQNAAGAWVRKVTDAQGNVTTEDVPPEQVPKQNPNEATAPVTRNGKTYIQHTVKKPDGTSDTFFTDQQGNKVELPAETKGPGKLPEGVTPPDFTKGDVVGELNRFWGELNARIGDGTNGTITGDQAVAIFTPYHQIAQSAQAEQTRRQTTQENVYGREVTQRGQDITQANERLGAANTISGNALKLGGSLLEHGASVGGSGAAIFPALMGLQGYNAASMGGFRETPRVNYQDYPAIASLMTIEVPGGPRISVPMTGGGPTPGAPGAISPSYSNGPPSAPGFPPGNAGASPGTVPVLDPRDRGIVPPSFNVGEHVSSLKGLDDDPGWAAALDQAAGEMAA